MGETEAFVREFFQIRGAVLRRMSAHRDLARADVVPAKVVDHVDDDVRLLSGVRAS